MKGKIIISNKYCGLMGIQYKEFKNRQEAIELAKEYIKPVFNCYKVSITFNSTQRKWKGIFAYYSENGNIEVEC